MWRQLRHHGPGREHGRESGGRDHGPGRRVRRHQRVRLVHGGADHHRRGRGVRRANPDFTYTVEGPGTGDGFKKFCAGETDISDASRTIKDEEATACAEAGIEYIELKVAIDGMSVLTSVNNTAVSCLSFADLYALVGPESTGFAKWSDAAAIAAELGSTTSFPDADLSITGPGEESGTFDSFVELALAKIAESRSQEANTRPDYTASANDNAIIDGISGSDTSLGWVGFAFAEENKDQVNEIQIAKDVNGTCVAPTAETIADGSYPLSRSLYIYVNKAKAAANPAVTAFVDYYLAEGTISSVLETVPVREPGSRDARRDPGRLGSREVALAPPGERVGPDWGPARSPIL